MEITQLSALELSRAIREKKTTAKEAVEAALSRIEKTEKDYHCYVTIDEEGARKRADFVQKKIENGELNGPLCGVPFAVKDNLCTEGLRTTCASKLLRDFIPTYSAEAVQKLERAGAVIIGKTNMDEFAFGSTTETSFFGSTKNPVNPAHVPGGSSGGSAAAVAAGECFFALGTDTGGSIRQPAGLCGVTGMKPTYGTVSRYGLIAYASSLDQIGSLCRNVADCAAVLECMSGNDVKDSTSLKRTDTDFSRALKNDVKGFKIGIPRQYFVKGIDPEVKEAVLRAAKTLEDLGAEVREFDLKYVDYAIPAYYTIASAEASSNLERFDGVKYGYRTVSDSDLHQMYKRTRSEGFGEEAKRRIMLGTFVLSSGYYDAYYLKALKVRALIKRAFDETFHENGEGFDLLLAPVWPGTAPKLGSSLTDPLKMYLGDIYTVAVNLAGLPAICIPCGRDQKGLSIGFQLIGDCFQEKKIFQAAYTYEQAVGRGTSIS